MSKKERRNEIARKYYGSDYEYLCSYKKKIVDDVVGVIKKR